jgi:hypothetical protein
MLAGPCKRFLKQSGFRVAPTVQIAFNRDRSKEDSNEKKNGARLSDSPWFGVNQLRQEVPRATAPESELAPNSGYQAPPCAF